MKAMAESIQPGC